MKGSLGLCLAILSLVALPSSGAAQGDAPDLSQMSIEDLMSLEITSASRREQRAADVAAAVFVITQDDIRRSGMTSLPDVLRMAPGIQVAQINSNKWAVSLRGSNALYANKLLVLVDGRTVYNRIFSGVLWDVEDLLLDDVDRIEVIRGPGAALWGANAVNGVVNIVTKSTADTQGWLARVDAGRSEQAAFRYGGTLGGARLRVYSQWTGREESLTPTGTRAGDASHNATTGFRAAWTMRPGAFVLQGDLTAGESRALWPNLDPRTVALEPLAKEPSDSQGGHLLGRWTHTRPGGASLQVQSFFDIASRQEPVGDYYHRAFDIDTQYHSAIGANHELVAGIGYRFIGERFEGGVGFSLTPARDNSSLVTAFVQDEIALLDKRLVVTLGSQVQYESGSGAGVQPTVRAIWKGLPRQRLWAAASRALRTPSLYERGIRLEYPPVPHPSGLPLVLTVVGNPEAETETLVDVEAGYRLDIATNADIDVTGFVGRYDHLRTQEVGDPVVEFVPSPRILIQTNSGNLLEATTRGLEVAGHWTPVPAWRLDGSFTAFHVTPQLAATSRDPLAALDDGNSPTTQWQLRSALSPLARLTVNVALFRVGALEQVQVDGYTRADVTAEWRFTRHLSAMAIGQNLFDAAHREFAGDSALLMATEMPRSASMRLRWTFR